MQTILLCLACFLPLLVTRAEATPLEYLTGAGEKAGPVVGLTWGVLLISLLVIVIIAGLLAGAVWHRPGLLMEPGARIPLAENVDGTRWLWIGVGMTSLALLLTVIWTVAVLARIEAPANKPAVTIEVTGRQWWWQVRYLSGDPSRIFTTANEIHIPAGQPVRLRLIGGDVIHSFWVPALTGKMDAIPGLTNETWLEAGRPGVYRGQCTEYCGLQHAHMGLVVIAQSPAGFRRWWDHQLEVPAATSPAEADFVAHCGGCHRVRGTDANGVVGPDLSHLMQRRTLAAATLPNTPGNLMHWISDPQSVKPGSLMPDPELSANDRASILSYLKMLN